MTTKPRRRKSAPPALRLEGELTVFRAAEFKALLRGEPAAERLDLSAVSEIDTAGVQLLLMARKAAQDGQRSLQLLAPSPAVKDVFELLGLASCFDTPPDSVRAPAGAAAPACNFTSARH